jgi:hypothetical protein
MIATHLIWRAAGYPTPPNAVQVQGVCWWCASGLDSVPLTGPALGVPLSTMPDTFLDALGRDAGAPASPYICPACAWTLSDAVCLPESVGVPLLHRALAGDQEHPGRLSVAVGDEPPARRLVTWVGNAARIGVWERPGKAADEAAWVAARPDLRTDPRDVGPARFLGAFDGDHLSSRVGGKFRNFIPYADGFGRWSMFTKADKAEIARILTNPPLRPWTMAIGDGQKHVAIYARVNGGGAARVQSVYFEGVQVTYAPNVLLGLLIAVQAMLCAGHRREHVESGRYLSLSGEMIAMTKRHEPTIRPFRGGPLLLLALWLAVKVEQESIEP